MAEPEVDRFIARQGRWGAELARLRALLLEAGLTETIKWGKPCYTLDGGNVAILHPMKEVVALSFFKGALLKDPEGITERIGENSMSGRWARLTSPEDLAAKEHALRALIAEAIAVEKAGLKPPAAEPRALEIPAELQQALDDDPAYAEAFAALTPGRQRSWALHVAGARQSATRTSRAEKARPRVLAGKGQLER